ncbi:MAG: pyridoxamine 5'-phosphate oxidase family protein [Myxococcota bacterium]
MNELKKTDRTRVRRIPARGSYDRSAADAILDEALICHVGFVVDAQPFVIPTIHARVDAAVSETGTPSARVFNSREAGAP